MGRPVGEWPVFRLLRYSTHSNLGHVASYFTIENFKASEFMREDRNSNFDSAWI